MNYKLNYLTAPVSCEDTVLHDFSTLKFGSTPDQTVVFDATAYCLEEGLTLITHTAFGHVCRVFIDRMLSNSNLTGSNLFYQTSDGHLLINKGLAYIFLMFVNPSVNDYFFGIIDEALTRGFAISDSYLASIVDERIPSEFLQTIIDSRRGEV